MKVRSTQVLAGAPQHMHTAGNVCSTSARVKRTSDMTAAPFEVAIGFRESPRQSANLDYLGFLGRPAGATGISLRVAYLLSIFAARLPSAFAASVRKATACAKDGLGRPNGGVRFNAAPDHF